MAGLLQPCPQPGYLALAETRYTDGAAGIAPIDQFGVGGEHRIHSQPGRYRSGHEGIGRGDDQQRIALRPVLIQQRGRLRQHHTLYHGGHETLVQRRELIETEAGQGFQHKGQMGVHIQLPSQILLVEIVVGLTEQLGVDQPFLYQELAPGVIGVAAQQRIIEIKNSQCHRRYHSPHRQAGQSTSNPHPPQSIGPGYNTDPCSMDTAMPELPEVETTRRGIAPHLLARRISRLVVRQPRLRWPVPPVLEKELPGQSILAVDRRAKYLLVGVDSGTLILHLGMSGSLRLIAADQPAGYHDHVDLVLDNERALRLTDPRRFGAVLWQPATDTGHPLLDHLGPEPLSEDFDGDYLFARSRRRRLPVKSLLMDQRIVVGVGNIYANEALFLSGIRPDRASGGISRARYGALATHVKQVLTHAIAQGGTTLRDFVGGDGRPGYFKQELHVYGRGGQPCTQCQRPLSEVRLGQRSTVFCQRCQH